MSLPVSNHEVAFEQRQIGCGSVRQLPNAVTVQVPNRDPATVKLFMDLWDKKQ